jgi:N-acetylmuramate 1-kinase
MSTDLIPPAAAPGFLATIGWPDATIMPLTGDASFRRYFRVTQGSRVAMLMDAPPPHEDAGPFIAVSDYLNEQGFSAPAVLAADLDVGLVLIEDFGEIRMRETMDAAPEMELPLYRDCIALLAALADKPAMALKPYSIAEYQRELGLFTEWYCSALSLSVDVDGYVALWDRLLAQVVAAQAKPVTVLRDYHAENIMLVPGRSGTARLGLLDFQDALVGHPAYDLVSMLQDARRDVSPEVEAAMLAHHATLAKPDAAFEAAYHILGVQRNLKILGIFTRLWKRDDKPRYRAFQPRVWGYIERSLAHPALAEMKAWMDRNVPVRRRAAAWEGLAR